MKLLVFVWTYGLLCAALMTWLLQVGKPPEPAPVTYYCFDPRPWTATTFEICELIPQKYNI